MGVTRGQDGPRPRRADGKRAAATLGTSSGLEFRNAWWWAVAFVAGLTFVSVDIGRYLDWDEAVFYSQSGGLDDASWHPSPMVASREVGTATVLGGLRLVGGGLPDTRVLWLALGIGVLGVSSRALGRVLPAPGWLIFTLFGSFWVTQLFIGGFFGFAIGASLAMLTTATYLEMRAGDLSDSRAVLLGLSAAAGLWMRQIETFLVLAVIAVHSVTVTPGEFWRRSRRPVAVAGATTLLTFVLPWIVDSIHRFGGVGDRIASARSQDFERGLVDNATAYVHVALGRSGYFQNLQGPDRWLRSLLLVAWLLLMGIALVGAWRTLRERGRGPRQRVAVGAMPLVVMLAAVLLGFFFFMIGDVSDRYLLFGLAFVAALGAVGIAQAIPSGAARPWATLPLVALVLWGSVNTAVARTYESERAAASAVTLRSGQVARVLAQERSCVGIARYRTPAVQLASGCMVGLADDQAMIGRTFTLLAEESVLAGGATPEFAFVLWPADDPLDFDSRWQHVHIVNPAGRDLTLSYLEETM